MFFSEHGVDDTVSWKILCTIIYLLI